MSKIYLFKNQDKTQSFEPDAFVRLKIGEEWKDLGTATSGMTAKGTPYYEMDVDDDTLVDKLRDIDWKPKGEKAGRFVKDLTDERMKREYPHLFEEKAEQDFQDY